ncbi:MAG TPA: peptidoglycan editing factor PgeF [Alphaproteobacteria bacterium]|nr:peptidoglycan editing factor PgeF [Alphaproteobacteria bacterium]
MIRLHSLSRLKGVSHAFFTRDGGVSTGLYASRNVGFGSDDARESVARNRALSVAELGAESLVTVHQVHSPDVATVREPWPHEDAPRADALVTDRPGVALGILTADCAPVLFADETAGVIGAAHAGWKGALSGVLEATVEAMARLGAAPGRIVAAVGPRISWASYEVGPEFRERFVAAAPENERFFATAARPGHSRFDLGGYVGDRLARMGLATVELADHDTVTDEARFFSYRRSVLRGEPDYGRFLSAVVLDAGG